MRERCLGLRIVGVVLLGAGLLTFLGCDSGGGGGGAGTGMMTLSVDGSGKSFSNVSGYTASGFTVVAAVNPATMYPFAGLTFPSGVGSYSSSSSDGCTLQWHVSSTTVYMASDGNGSYSINITSHGGTVTGTFSGTLPKSGGGSVTITGGSFSALLF